MSPWSLPANPDHGDARLPQSWLDSRWRAVTESINALSQLSRNGSLFSPFVAGSRAIRAATARQGSVNPALIRDLKPRQRQSQGSGGILGNGEVVRLDSASYPLGLVGLAGAMGHKPPVPSSWVCTAYRPNSNSDTW